MSTQKIRHKSLAITVAVPGNAAAVSASIAGIGLDQRELARIEASMGDELAAVKERWETIAEPHKKRIAAATQGVQVWCEAHRSELLKGDAKTAIFPAGEVQWRVRPPSVRVTGADAVLDLLRRLGLGRFIRQKEEINKEAILNEPAAVAAVPGIRIDQAEDFVIKPFEEAISGL